MPCSALLDPTQPEADIKPQVNLAQNLHQLAHAPGSTVLCCLEY
jgi:hypothetical protein